MAIATKDKVIELINVMQNVSYIDMITHLRQEYGGEEYGMKEMYDFYQSGIYVLKERIKKLEWQ